VGTIVVLVSTAKYESPVYCAVPDDTLDCEQMPTEPLPLHEAISAAIGDRSQTELADLLGVGQSNISKWMRGVTRPSLDDIVRLEKVCGRRRGFILKAAGYVDEAVPSTAEAIENDPRLDDLGRRIVLATYEAALSQ
jgi:plasmid maintenance system antidote protein VapI